MIGLKRKLTFTDHCRKRMKQRKINETQIIKAIMYHDSMTKSYKSNNFVFHNFRLSVVARINTRNFFVITAWKTTKIN